ncbi:carbonyl reductase [Patellaria atrata CBS 101060]|uniref:Carbonyl reductase n=1 Tax=Patellaria atrata CBS 101060 TaxID=1346257 RepID=A0A9P4S1I7_9PEZI|nr:carbonyl reductase [Patellaria atrata CBS 101060]
MSSEYATIGVVTGANKGVGLATVRNLALQYPNSNFNKGPFLIYLTARDVGRGEAAVSQLNEDSQLRNANALRAAGGLTDIRYYTLDIAQKESIQDFAQYLKTTHNDGIDFVINNAGIALDGFNADLVRDTLHTNYYGSLNATYAFLPLLKLNGRLVNVSSEAGKLSKFSPSIRSRFLSARSVDDVTVLMEEFQAAVEEGREKDAGFPSAAYATSKAGMTGFTTVIAREEKEKGSEVLINAVTPGYTNTDMSKGNGTKTPDEGSRTLVLVALGDIGKQTALFWQDERPVEW